MNLSRRKLCQWMVTGTMVPQLTITLAHAAEIAPWHEDIAAKARQLNTGKALQVLIPNGSGANIKAAADIFTQLSGIECVVTEVAVDEINIELILRANSGETSVDVALPATFGIPDLVEAGAINELDDWATKHEPASLDENYLYRKGDYYHDHLFGYQTDGDAYMLFYNKRMLQDEKEQQAFKKLTGRPLQEARTWEELDQMMKFFHRPESDQYGGNLFRNPGYLVWEWWARFHAKGYFPFDEKMRPNINNDAGVAALEELIEASNYLSPGAVTNGLFDNWEEFSKGNVFCNIGWGGTQKFLMKQPNMRDNLIHSSLPGPTIDNAPSTMGYFNWGWNFTVSSQSAQPELSYLFCLFCTSPTVSTLAVREEDGYFDPFHTSHYEDDIIKSVYGESFLDAHKQSLGNSIPDLYLSGQSNYLDSLRQQILSAVSGDMTAQETLDICAQKWTHISRRLGVQEQREQWNNLKQSYPDRLRQALSDS